MNSYTIIRVNPEINTITVLLSIDGRELQEDVSLEGLTDKDMVANEIENRLSKFKFDLDKVPNTDLQKDLESLLGHDTPVKEIADLKIEEAISLDN